MTDPAAALPDVDTTPGVRIDTTEALSRRVDLRAL
jgi:hypothetical protein